MNDKKCTNFIYQSTNPIYYEIQSQRQIYRNGESELLKYQTVMVSFRKKKGLALIQHTVAYHQQRGKNVS